VHLTEYLCCLHVGLGRRNGVRQGEEERGREGGSGGGRGGRGKGGREEEGRGV